MRPDQCHGEKEYKPAPLRFALVPVEITPEMIDVYHDNVDSEGPKTLWFNLIEASPGNDLLERIVRARDEYRNASTSAERDSAAWDLVHILDELGAGHG